MVLDKKDVDAVMSIEDGAGFKTVQAPLQRLVESSMAGQRLFGSCWKQLAAELLKAEVVTAKKELLALPAVTYETLSNIKAAAAERISQISTLHLLAARREVDVEYHNLWLPMVVRSASEFVDVQLHAALRSLAVSSGALQPLNCETVGNEGRKNVIDSELTMHAVNVSLFFGSMLSVQEKIDGDTVLVTLFTPSLFFGGMDLKKKGWWEQFWGENSGKLDLGQMLSSCCSKRTRFG